MAVWIPQRVAFNLCIGTGVINQQIGYPVLSDGKAAVSRAEDGALGIGHKHRLLSLVPAFWVEQIGVFIGPQSSHAIVFIGCTTGIGDQHPTVSHQYRRTLLYPETRNLP